MHKLKINSVNSVHHCLVAWPACCRNASTTRLRPQTQRHPAAKHAGNNCTNTKLQNSNAGIHWRTATYIATKMDVAVQVELNNTSLLEQPFCIVSTSAVSTHRTIFDSPWNVIANQIVVAGVRTIIAKIDAFLGIGVRDGRARASVSGGQTGNARHGICLIKKVQRLVVDSSLARVGES